MYIKHIYLIRHGQTEYNLKGMVQGSGVDAPLNETGQAQAAAFYEAYKHIGFQKIYTSQLKRAWQSVERFAEDGITIERYAGLNEICWGVYEGRDLGMDGKRIYNAMLQSWREGNTAHRIKGGESPEDVAIRQRPVLDLILQREEEKKILICMHGRAMRILLCQILGRPIGNMEDFRHDNLGMYHLGIKANGEMDILQENCVAHLNDADQPA